MHGTLGSLSDPILWLGGGMSPTNRLITQVTVPSILTQAQNYHTIAQSFTRRAGKKLEVTYVPKDALEGTAALPRTPENF